MAIDKRENSFRSGELARIVGVSADTLRHYERVGVLPHPPRYANGYRRYPDEALQRVTIVRQALAVGFSLSELARILQTRDRGGTPCREVRALAGRKLEQMERQLADLKSMLNRVKSLLHDWDRRLAATPKGERARLLESLAISKNKTSSRNGAHK